MITRFIVRLLPIILGFCLTLPAGAASSDTPVDRQVADAIKSSEITIVHLWAPWCTNCMVELKDGGWTSFIEANPEVHFIFVTVWSDKDGRDVLEKSGVAEKANVTILSHPNTKRSGSDRVHSFVGMPVTWVPTTGVFKDGKMYYYLGYGEIHFPLLQQLIRDSRNAWVH